MQPRLLWRLLPLIAHPRLQLLRCRWLRDEQPNPNRRQYCHHQLWNQSLRRCSRNQHRCWAQIL